MAGPNEETRAYSRYRDKGITVDRVLQTVGGILLLIVTGISSWALLKAIDLGERVIRLETQQTGTDATLKEMKGDIKEILAELKKKP